MKTLHVICLGALTLLTACKNEEKSPESQTPSTDTTITSIQKVTPRATAATWTGKYSGVLPCGDCKGIKTIIEVNADSTYTLLSQALGKENVPRKFNGLYSFDKDKNMITLDAEGDHLKFQQQDGMLIKRDKFGDPEQGDEEARYFLHRVQ